MAKVGFGFLFLYLRHVSLFVRSLPGWRLSRETWVEERDKNNFISRQEEKPTLLLADPYRKTIFFQRKTQGSDLSFWTKLQKQHEKCFSQGFFSKADAPRIPMTAGLCAVQSSCSRGGWVYQSWITKEQTISSCYIQIREICLSIRLINGAAAHHRDTKFTGNSSFYCSIIILFTISLQNPCGCKSHMAERLRERIKGAFLWERSSYLWSSRLFLCIWCASLVILFLVATIYYINNCGVTVRSSRCFCACMWKVKTRLRLWLWLFFVGNGDLRQT